MLPPATEIPQNIYLLAITLENTTQLVLSTVSYTENLTTVLFFFSGGQWDTKPRS